MVEDGVDLMVKRVDVPVLMGPEHWETHGRLLPAAEARETGHGKVLDGGHVGSVQGEVFKVIRELEVWELASHAISCHRGVQYRVKRKATVYDEEFTRSRVCAVLFRI